jgi:hypothetical protein
MKTATLLPTPAAEALEQSPLPDLRYLHVAESESEVIITGKVSSYYLKQLAQETVRPALGARRLLNKVVVNSRRPN